MREADHLPLPVVVVVEVVMVVGELVLRSFEEGEKGVSTGKLSLHPPLHGPLLRFNVEEPDHP